MIAAPCALSEIVAVEVGHDPARRNGVDADALEGELEPERLGELDDAGLRHRIGGGALGDAEAEHRGDVDDGSALARRRACGAPPPARRRTPRRDWCRSRAAIPSGGSSTARPACTTPALLTRMVTVPKASSARSKARVIAGGRARRPRSRAHGRRRVRCAPAPPPAVRCGARPARRRRLPPASTSAKRTPSPLEAPVTRATRPVRSNSEAAVILGPEFRPLRPRRRAIQYPPTTICGTASPAGKSCSPLRERRAVGAGPPAAPSTSDPLRAILRHSRVVFHAPRSLTNERDAEGSPWPGTITTSSIITSTARNSPRCSCACARWRPS